MGILLGGGTHLKIWIKRGGGGMEGRGFRRKHRLRDMRCLEIEKKSHVL